MALGAGWLLYKTLEYRRQEIGQLLKDHRDERSETYEAFKVQLEGLQAAHHEERELWEQRQERTEARNNEAREQTNAVLGELTTSINGINETISGFGEVVTENSREIAALSDELVRLEVVPQMTPRRIRPNGKHR